MFKDIRRRMPFVPGLFKALADDPAALLPAWLQARALYDDPAAAAAAESLRRLALPRLDFAPVNELSEAVRPFLEELPFMLLIVSSFSLTLGGVLPLRSQPDSNLPPPGPVPSPEFSDRGEHPLFADICRVYGTRHLPSIFRMLAAGGLLEESWRSIGPFLSSPEGLTLVDRLRTEAERAASTFPDCAFFSVERAQPLIDQFRRAMPRSLCFAVAASGRP